MKELVLCIAGQIASGKTTFSHGIATYLSWKRAGFGDFIRMEAMKRGLDSESRDVLQRIGTELIDTGWISFCSSFLRAFEWNKGDGLVVDGVRHIECIQTLQKLVEPMDLILVYIEIDPKERESRFKQRGLDASKINVTENHETEQHHSDLRLRANLILDGCSTIQENIQKVDGFLGAF